MRRPGCHVNPSLYSVYVSSTGGNCLYSEYCGKSTNQKSSVFFKKITICKCPTYKPYFFKLGLIKCTAGQSLQGMDGVTKKRITKWLKHTKKLFRKNLQIKCAC